MIKNILATYQLMLPLIMVTIQQILPFHPPSGYDKWRNELICCFFVYLSAQIQAEIEKRFEERNSGKHFLIWLFSVFAHCLPERLGGILKNQLAWLQLKCDWGLVKENFTRLSRLLMCSNKQDCESIVWNTLKECCGEWFSLLTTFQNDATRFSQRHWRWDWQRIGFRR